MVSIFIGFTIQCAFVRRRIVPIFVKQFVNDDVCPVTGEDGPAELTMGELLQISINGGKTSLSTCTTQYSCWQPVSTKLL